MMLQPIHIFALASVAGAVRPDQMSMTVMASGIIDEANVTYAATTIPFNNATAGESSDSTRKRRNALIPERSSASFLNLSDYNPDFGKGSYKDGTLSYDYEEGRFYCELGQKLGEGAYASVYECAAEQEKLAVKFITDPTKVAASIHEFATQQKIHSEHVVKAKAAFLMEGGAVIAADLHVPSGALCIVMELVPHELFNLMHLTRGDIYRTTSIWLQVLKGVTAVHEAGFIWRDLKPENILCTTDDPEKMEVKICDFGLAVEMGEHTGLTGTPEYFAPEQARGQPYDERVDAWALGVLYYEMYYKSLPFVKPDIYPDEKENRAQLYQKIIQREVDFYEVVHGAIPKGMKDLILGCLTKDPEQRLRVLASDTSKQISSQPWVAQWPDSYHEWHHECQQLAQWLKAKRFQDVHDTRVGGDMKSKSFGREYPLHVAVKDGNLEMVKLLINHDSPTTSRDYANRTPKELAIYLEKTQISALIPDR